MSLNKAYIRCDASRLIGSGHLVRCLALAEQLHDEGFAVHFLCQNHEGSDYSAVQTAGFQITLLDPTDNQETDAKNVLKLIDKTQNALIVVDHYQLDKVWEGHFYHQHFLLVIDDLANRTHLCHALLDNNYSQQIQTRYNGLTPAHCHLLLGPQNSIVRREFREINLTLTTQNGSSQRSGILCFFGGHDADGYTLQLLQALSEYVPAIKLKILVARTNTYLEQILKIKPANDKVEIIVQPDNLAKLFRSCELYFGSGGTVTWERMLCSLPGVVVAVADNQIAASESLARDNAQWYLGTARKALTTSTDEKGSTQMIQALKFCENIILHEAADLEETRKRNQQLVQPVSIKKIVHAYSDLRLKKATIDDAKFLYDLRKDPTVNTVSIQKNEFNFDDHIKWLTNKLADQNSKLFILVYNNKPVGQLRLDGKAPMATQKASFTVSISLAAAARGQGLATRALSMATELAPAIFHAYIQPQNTASINAFKSAGFVFKESQTITGEEYHLYTKST